MPRPKRCRRVCREPIFRCFYPDGVDSPERVELSVDEYEVIRLVDFEKKNHEQCSEVMDISRTTVTEIYESARYKISDCLVNGKQLCISGGNYRICQGQGTCLGRRCRKEKVVSEKGENIMRIAVTYENGEIFQHFGHTEQFKLYDVENYKVVDSKVVGSNGAGHGALADFLQNNGVEVLICGGIGGGAQTALAEAGIKLFGGVTGEADLAVQNYLDGKLNFNPDVKCDHHDHEHGEGHHCGDHGCGKHGCGNH